MGLRKKKAQISFYLDPDVMTMLADYAARRNQSQSLVVEAAAQAARAKAGERYDAFVTALGRRLAKGPKLRQEIPEDVTSVGGGTDG